MCRKEAELVWKIVWVWKVCVVVRFQQAVIILKMRKRIIYCSWYEGTKVSLFVFKVIYYVKHNFLNVLKHICSSFSKQLLYQRQPRHWRECAEMGFTGFQWRCWQCCIFSGGFKRESFSVSRGCLHFLTCDPFLPLHSQQRQVERFSHRITDSESSSSSCFLPGPCDCMELTG